MDHEVVVRQKLTERYLLGELDGQAREEFEEHYFDCPDCAVDVHAAAGRVGDDQGDGLGRGPGGLGQGGAGQLPGAGRAVAVPRRFDRVTHVIEAIWQHPLQRVVRAVSHFGRSW